MYCFLEKQGKNLWGNDWIFMAKPSSPRWDRFLAIPSAEEPVFAINIQSYLAMKRLKVICRGESRK